MRRRVPRALVALHVLLGAFGVHELRYAIAPSPAREVAHGYFEGIPALVAGLLAVALWQVAVSTAGRAATGRALGWPARWLLATGGFLAIYGAQESVEALVSTGAPVSPAELLAHGGWVVVPLALAAGGVLAALLRGTEAALARLEIAFAGEAAVPVPAPVLRRSGGPVCAPLVPPAPELARHLAGRAPPRLLIAR